MLIIKSEDQPTKREGFGKSSVATIFFFLVSCSFMTLRFSMKIDQVINVMQYPQTLFDGPSIVHTNETIMHEPENMGDQQREKIVEAPRNAIDDESVNDSFSACILWMDDNHRLEEWLAYHYYALKLRYVVLNIDPFSRTSPQEIIDRWNDRENKYKLNMTIVTMKDSEYIWDYEEKMKKIEEAKNSTSDDPEYDYGRAKTEYHRARQKDFYKACTKHLVLQNKTWTSYHDTDEFLTFLHEYKDENITADSYRKMERPGYILDAINSIKKEVPDIVHANETGFSCLVVDRRRYCAKELSTEETNSLFSPSSDSASAGIIPEGFMHNSINSNNDKDREAIVRRFDTLRYKFLTKGNDGQPKSFVDLSQRLPKLYAEDRSPTGEKAKTPHAWSVHRAMLGLCKKEEKFRRKELKDMVSKERFTVSHYLGSFEYYSFRDDARQGGLRTYEIWKKRALETRGEFSHVVRPWLRGFVKLVGGAEVASFLLQDAGKFPEDYNVTSRIEEYNGKYDHDKNAIRRGKKKKKKQR